MKRVQLIDLSPEQLVEMFDERLSFKIDGLKKELLHENANDDLLTREQTAELLKINLSTLHAWVNNGKLKAYSISGSRRYFKRSEIMDALKQLKK